MSLYAPNAVRIPPNEPAADGKEAILRGVEQLFDSVAEFTFQEKYNVEDVKVAGGLAVAHLAWSGIYTPKAGGESLEHGGNWVMAFEKQPDGSWKILYSI